MPSQPGERNQASTIWVGNLDDQVTQELLWELFIQAGPVVDVVLPVDKVTGQKQNYAFVEFAQEQDAIYAIKIMNMVKLYGKSIRINRAIREQEALDVGANLFIGNLDKEVDEQLLYTTFSAFGIVIDVSVVMNETSDTGFGFVHFTSFEASDAALEAMNGQFLCNRPVHISYAYKKGGRNSERHGSAAERALAAERSKTLGSANLVAAKRAQAMYGGATIPSVAPPNIPSLPSQPVYPSSMPPPPQFRRDHV